jgi:ADP-heptose:LPS heptosyltransferase
MESKMPHSPQISTQDIKQRRQEASKKRQRKRQLEGRVYAKFWGRSLPEVYPALDPDSIKRILLLQCHQRIGDLVVAMTVTGGLRKAYPQAHIAAMVPGNLKELAAADKAVNEVIPESRGSGARRFLSDLWTIRKKKWDVVAALGIQAGTLLLAKLSCATWQLGYSYNRRGDHLNRPLVPHHSCNQSGWEYEPAGVPHIVDFWAELFRRGGVPIEPSNWEYLDLPAIPPYDSTGGLRGGSPIIPVRNGAEEKLRISLHPFSGNPMRNWMLGRWSMLGRELLQQYDAQLMITGSSENQTEARWLANAIGGECVSTAGKMSLVQTWSALRELDVVISVDTAVIHMATAVGVPVVSLFGPGDPAIWGPYGQLHRVIQCFPECQRCKGGHCVQPKVHCMEAITVDRVLESVEAVLKDRHADESSVEILNQKLPYHE